MVLITHQVYPSGTCSPEKLNSSILTLHMLAKPFLSKKNICKQCITDHLLITVIMMNSCTFISYRYLSLTFQSLFKSWLLFKCIQCSQVPMFRVHLHISIKPVLMLRIIKM